MARKSDRVLVEELTRTFEPRIRDAFRAAVRDITENATLRVIAERLERGDVSGAIDALGIDPAAYGPLEQAVDAAYNGAGQATVENWPAVRDQDGLRVVFRFGVRNNEAEFWLRGHSSQLVTRIVDDQRQAVRETLQTGLSEGRNPRSTALDVIGRVNRATGRREGGIVGLTAAQARYVAAARAELLSGDPEAMTHYLGRQRRDRRFDKAVAAAIREERPVDAATVAKATGRYSDRLLQLRGEILARTETITALNKARYDAIRQQVMAGKIDPEDVTKVWQSAADDRTRDTHRALHGRKVGLEEPFLSPSGALLMYPGDPNAPASEHIACRCWLRLAVDFLGRVVRRAA